MIVREGADGELILIAQTDHAKVSGQCAAHWGNGTFARPEPNEAVVRAAMFHDSGWYDYEASPTIAPDTGRPLNSCKSHGASRSGTRSSGRLSG